MNKIKISLSLYFILIQCICAHENEFDHNLLSLELLDENNIELASVNPDNTLIEDYVTLNSESSITYESSIAYQVWNETSTIDALRHYGADFTDTDGDGMTDVAELKYGFDPNDSNSFPTKDYTFLYEDGTPTLHESSGVTDPLNEIRFMFTESEWLLNRKGESNLETLKNNREFLNLMMPILLEELGPPPESFTVKISCTNRGAYANGTRISVNDNSAPGSYIHEIGHVWKYGWVYSFMKLGGSKRGNFRGFEEGFSEALKYNVCNKFVEAYPNHPYVTKYFTTGRNAETWRGGVYDFDVTLGNPTFSGGTFWSGRYTQYRYENSSGIFSVLTNQREGVMRDLLRVFYENAENNPDWDWTINSQDIFNLWESVLPEVNGIDTSDWLTQTKLLDGKPVSQRLYVTIIDGCAYFMYPDSQGNFSWKYDSLFAVNAPSWFPTKQVNGKWIPDVSNIPFNLEVRTINGEVARESQRTTSTKDLAETYMSEIHTDALPIGLYKATVNFPTYEQHSEHTSGTSYVIGTQHTLHSNDELNIHVGVDIPSATRVRMSINDDLYESELINGLSVFRFNDIGIDYTGAIEILIFDGNTERTYKRAVSHFGTRSGTRLNEFVIADRDFDGVEDAFDSSVLTILPMNYVNFSEIEKTAHLIANPKTEKINLLNVIHPFTNPTIYKPYQPLNLTIQEKLDLKIIEIKTLIDKLKMEEATVLDDLAFENHIFTEPHLDESNDALVGIDSLVDFNASNDDDDFHVTNEDFQDYANFLTQTIDILENTLPVLEDASDAILDSEMSKADGIEEGKTMVISDPSLYALVTLSVHEQALLDANESMQQAIEDTKVTAKREGINEGKEIGILEGQQSVINNPSAYNLFNFQQYEEILKSLDANATPYTKGWFYTPNQGWMWSRNDLYPWFYDRNSSDWMYFQSGHANPRFYHYGTKQWMTLE